MKWFKERTPCRRKVKVLLKKYDCNLAELLSGKFFKLNSNMQKQTMKMIQEEEAEKNDRN